MQFRRAPSPTFKHAITVATHEGEAKITVEYRHMRRSEFEAYFSDAYVNNVPHTDQLLKIAAGWDVAEFKFTPEDVREFDQLYPAVCPQLVMGYAKALAEGRLGN